MVDIGREFLGEIAREIAPTHPPYKRKHPEPTQSNKETSWPRSRRQVASFR